MDHNIEQAKNMKLLLGVFEHLPGLKINFHKSELFCYGDAKECEDQYTQLFGCAIGALPIKYLGIPMIHRKLRNSN
uniref:Reverse transcriptase domain-containing protein n=1 Tax=Arundo donax TaxID=35708 RepID=A0A0A8Z3M2_ARUDO